MNLIEQAAKRLQELERAGVNTTAHTGESTLGLSTESILADRPASSRTRREPELRKPPPAQEPGRDGPMLDEDLGAIPRSRRIDLDLSFLHAASIMTPDAPRSRLADEFRVIKRPLIENAAKRGAAAIRNGNLIIVTSALPGEGKSFTAANLAMSIAMEMDKTVLLVDADVARPSLPSMLGLPPAQGLLDLLLDESLDVSDVLMKTNIDTLSILASGTPHVRATELLASDAMKRLLDEMAQRYSDRLIIFDSPPLLVTTEARVLASHMGQVLLVVQAEQTASADVSQALSTIEHCPVKLMMLNKRRAAATSSYGYGYGYGYEYEHRG
jgi:exopolysaccharide/PEP-CTERM locus tyrosine autokinase